MDALLIAAYILGAIALIGAIFGPVPDSKPPRIIRKPFYGPDHALRGYSEEPAPERSWFLFWRW